MPAYYDPNGSGGSGNDQPNSWLNEWRKKLALYSAPDQEELRTTIGGQPDEQDFANATMLDMLRATNASQYLSPYYIQMMKSRANRGGVLADADLTAGAAGKTLAEYGSGQVTRGVGDWLKSYYGSDVRASRDDMRKSLTRNILAGQERNRTGGSDTGQTQALKNLWETYELAANRGRLARMLLGDRGGSYGQTLGDRYADAATTYLTPAVAGQNKTWIDYLKELGLTPNTGNQFR